MWDNAALLRNIADTLIAFSVLAVLYGAGYYTVHLPGLLPLRYAGITLCAVFLIGLAALPFAPETRGRGLAEDDAAPA